MVIELGRDELKEMIMEMVREELTPTQVLAGLIWHFCINSRDHFYKGEYYDLPVSFQYDNDGVSILDVNYLKQRNQWSLISPDYKHIMRIAPLVLKWLDDTYFAYIASKQQMSALRKPRRRRRRGMRTRRTRQRPRRRAIAPSPSRLTTPLSQPQSSPRQRPQPQKQARTQERQKEQGGNQGNDQNYGDGQNNFS